MTVHRCVSDTLQLPDPLLRRESVDTIVPGVTYTCLFLPQGPWLLHVATIELNDRQLMLDVVRAKDHMVGRERVSAMAARLAARGDRPVVGINADFFDLGTGEIENNNVIHGEWVKGTLTTDSPHDEFDNAHTQFAIDARGAARIGRFALEGAVLAPSGTIPLVGINYRPPRLPGLVLYTPWYGPRTLSDTSSRALAARPLDPDATPPRTAGVPTSPAAANAPAPSASQLRADSAQRETLAATHDAVEATVVAAGRRGDTLLYRVHDAPLRTGGGIAIPSNGAVLSATGAPAIAALRAAARRGSVLKVVARLTPSVGAPQLAVGGWPRVVRDGRNVGSIADSLEGTFPRFSAARHPRSVIALTRDSTRLMLVVVDGRRPWSVGMSLTELGDALLALGAGEAMNLDGGGSSTLWINGAVVNYPSDPSGERAVGNALFVRRRAPDSKRR
ncbi:MAG: phosphodiester glycosidase family protein [Gemmatimonadota bacterium]